MSLTGLSQLTMLRLAFAHALPSARQALPPTPHLTPVPTVILLFLQHVFKKAFFEAISQGKSGLEITTRVTMKLTNTMEYPLCARLV